jgi:hypothetical protein
MSMSKCVFHVQWTHQAAKVDELLLFGSEHAARCLCHETEVR